MAFEVMFKDNSTRLQWSWGSPKPVLNYSPHPDVVFFQADGVELELIKQQFVNVPHCRKATVWRGDMAQFIYDNL